MNVIPADVLFFTGKVSEELYERRESLRDSITRLSPGALNFGITYSRMQAEIDLLDVLLDRLSSLAEELFINDSAN